MGSPRLACDKERLTSTFEDSCGCTVLDMLESMDTIELTDRGKTQPPQVACTSLGRSEVLRSLRHHLQHKAIRT